MRRPRLSGSIRESTAVRAAIELPLMTARVVTSKVGVVAEERGGVANVIMGLIAVVVVSFGGAFGENVGGFG